MASLVIGDNEYQVPSDISLDKWVELNKWSSNPIKFVSIGMDMPLEEAAIIPEETLALATALLVAIMNPDWHPVKQKLWSHPLLDFNELKLGQFIDLENYIAEYTKQMPNMVKVLYDIEDVEEVKLGDVYSAIKSYMNWRTLLYKQYSRLFNIDDEAEEVSDKPKVNNTAHIWFDIVMVLAGNDFCKMEYVLDQPVNLCLNWLAWNKDKQRAEAERLKKERIKNRR